MFWRWGTYSGRELLLSSWSFDLMATHCQLHRLKCSLWDVVGPIHTSRSVSVRELLTDLS